MAAKKKDRRPKQVPFGEITWVMDNLSENELAAHDKLARTGDNILAMLSELFEQDWKLSVKWDYYSGCIQASLIQTNAEKPNAGYAFSSRSRDMLDALSLLVYKYYDIAEGVLDQFTVSKENLRG